MMRSLKSFPRICAAVIGSVALGVAHSAAASGDVQIDTAGVGGATVHFCTLGQACGFGVKLSNDSRETFNLGLGNGTTFDTVYIYREGVIGLGSALPVGATLGNLASLGSAYAAPGFGDYSGLDVHVTFVRSGGNDHGLNNPGFGIFPTFNDDVLIDWYVGTPVPGGPDTNLGEFQIKLHTGQFGTAGGDSITFHYGGQLGDPNTGAQGLYWPGNGLAPGALIGLNRSGDAPQPPPQPGGVPEPATWALLVGGFGLLGARLRRRRLIPTTV